MKDKYKQFGISIKTMPRVIEYQKKRFPPSYFNKLPFGTQMNLTLSSLLDDADLLEEMIKKIKVKEKE